LLEEPGGPEAALGRARLELEEARRELEQLRQEYARREQRAVEEVAAAGRESLLRVGRRIGPLLSQFATMRALAAQGKEVRREDLLTMAGKLEKAFAESGLAVIGEVGSEAAFDPKIHQRLSGGDVKDGDSVRVRFIGYAFGETVVTKALVSREAAGENDRAEAQQ
jgi:molecular chaperone GrpE (heat shock protein)